MNDVPDIKQNASGVWNLYGEQLWDSDILPVCLEHIKEGDTVIDAGAWIGGHTMAYAKKVGVNGKVVAFEPNPAAFDCLDANTEQFKNVQTYCAALGDKAKREGVILSVKKGWMDSGYISSGLDGIEVWMEPLDNHNLSPNFIKIDVEGCELKVLKGAVKTIEKSRPIMVVEINRPALERYGNTRNQVLDWLHENRYAYSPIDNYMNDVYNILCLPR